MFMHAIKISANKFPVLKEKYSPSAGHRLAYGSKESRDTE